MSALVFDIDNGAGKHIVIDPFTFAKELECKCLLASSASSTNDYPRGRIIVPCSRDITPDEYRRIQKVVHRHYYLKFWSKGMTEENFVLDRKMMTPSQAYYLPQQPTDKENGFGFVEAFDDPLFDPDAYLAQLPPERKPRGRPPAKRTHEPLSLEQAIEGLKFFDAGDPKDRFLTCLVFAKNWPYGRSAWEEWHRAGSTKWEDRKDFWQSQANESRLRSSSYKAVDIGWFIKEAKRRGWQLAKTTTNKTEEDNSHETTDTSRPNT